MVDLISTPVTSGFTTATSIIVVLSQVKGILGVRFKGDTVTDILEKLIIHFHERRTGDMVLGLGAIVLLLAMRVRFILFYTLSIKCIACIQIVALKICSTFLGAYYYWIYMFLF